VINGGAIYLAIPLSDLIVELFDDAFFSTSPKKENRALGTNSLLVKSMLTGSTVNMGTSCGL